MILEEEWEHHRYTVRDRDAIAGGVRRLKRACRHNGVTRISGAVGSCDAWCSQLSLHSAHARWTWTALSQSSMAQRKLTR